MNIGSIINSDLKKQESFFDKRIRFNFWHFYFAIGLNGFSLENTHSDRSIIQIKLSIKETIIQLWSRGGTSCSSLFLFNFRYGYSVAFGEYTVVSFELCIFNKQLIYAFKVLKIMEKDWEKLEIVRTHKSKKIIRVRKHNFESTSRLNK